MLIEAHTSISQTSPSLCFVNNYSASTYKKLFNSLDTGQPGVDVLMGRRQIFNECLIALWH